MEFGDGGLKFGDWITWRDCVGELWKKQKKRRSERDAFEFMLYFNFLGLNNILPPNF